MMEGGALFERLLQGLRKKKSNVHFQHIAFAKGII